MNFFARYSRYQTTPLRTTAARSLLLVLLVALASTGAGIPPRPEQLVFGERRFETPPAERHRHPLGQGAVAYVAEDHTLPIFDLSVVVRAGAFEEPPGRIGLARLTSALVRSGGTRQFAPAAFDEKAEFLAAEIRTSSDDTHANASLSCIRQQMDACLDLFFEMVSSPRFDPERISVEKAQWLENLKQRNDDAGDVLRREWDWLLYGRDSYTARSSTAADLGRIDRQNVIDFHRRTWRPQEAVISVSGDVTPDEILPRLEKYLAAWPTQSKPSPWPPAAQAHTMSPGIFYVDKAIPQGKVYLGHPAFRVTDWSSPDIPAILVMDHILGNGSFSSRLVQRVRSDEGLAYNIGSSFAFDPFLPSQFRASYQSKSATVALAAKIVLEEIRRLQTEPVSPKDLALAKEALIDSFPRRFESARQIASTYALDATIGRPHGYWQTWRERIAAVDTDDVLRVAKAHLAPERMTMLVVGDWTAIAAGDADQRAKIEGLLPGTPNRLPLRDPLTLEPLP